MFRGRSPRVLLLEIVGVLAVVAAAGVGAYLHNRASHPTPTNNRPVGGAQIDVSKNVRTQTQAALAVDPARPKLLFGASMDRLTDTRLYSSSDGGRTWTKALGPGGVRAVCGHSEPDVAIDGGGRQYLAFLSATGCSPPDPQLVVASRAGATGPWSFRAVAPAARDSVFDARPALAVGHGHVYVVWTRYKQRFTKNALVSAPELVLSRSDDSGRTWTKPMRVWPQFTKPYFAAAVVGRDGTVYLAAADGALQQLVLLRSTDRGATFSKPVVVSRLLEPFIPGCTEGSMIVRAQPQHCTGPNQTVLVDHSGHVVITYAEPEPNGTDAVWVASFDAELRPVLEPTRVGPADANPADQFLPVSAIDASNGALWACYYDTAGDSGRKVTWFTCTASRDGGKTWAAPVRAASRPSDETTVAGDQWGYGYAGLVAAAGAAHPFWVDTRNMLKSGEEIYTSVIPLSRLRVSAR